MDGWMDDMTYVDRQVDSGASKCMNESSWTSILVALCECMHAYTHVTSYMSILFDAKAFGTRGLYLVLSWAKISPVWRVSCSNEASQGTWRRAAAPSRAHSHATEPMGRLLSLPDHCQFVRSMLQSFQNRGALCSYRCAWGLNTSISFVLPFLRRFKWHMDELQLDGTS